MDRLQAKALLEEKMPLFAEFMREQALRGLSLNRLNKVCQEALSDGIRDQPLSERLVRNLRDAVSGYARLLVDELKNEPREMSEEEESRTSFTGE